MKFLNVTLLVAYLVYAQNIKYLTWLDDKSKYLDTITGALIDIKALNNEKSGVNDFLTLDPEKLNHQKSCEVEITYRNFKKNFNFVTSHSALNFGVLDQYLYVAYFYENNEGDVFRMAQTHIWKVPSDDLFRVYKFRFDPKQKRATISVDDKVVWDYTSVNQLRIFCHNDDKIIFLDGKIMESTLPYVKRLVLSQKD
jgi:hypothetical protein